MKARLLGWLPLPQQLRTRRLPPHCHPAPSPPLRGPHVCLQRSLCPCPGRERGTRGLRHRLAHLLMSGGEGCPVGTPAPLQLGLRK